MAKKILVTDVFLSSTKDTMRGLVEALNLLPDIKKGGLYHTLLIAMQTYLETLGIISIPKMMLLMQEVGALRRPCVTEGSGTVWEVICITFFDDVVTLPWLKKACINLEKHEGRLRELQLLHEQVIKLNTRWAEANKSSVGAETSTASSMEGSEAKVLDQIAEMVVKIEELEAELQSRDARIIELTSELAKLQAVDPSAALAAAIVRARERKAQS